jgi:hypothetical protein
MDFERALGIERVAQRDDHGAPGLIFQLSRRFKQIVKRESLATGSREFRSTPAKESSRAISEPSGWLLENRQPSER